MARKPRRETYIDSAKGKLSKIVHLRSMGYSAYEVAGRLGLMAWEVYQLTQFIRVCITLEEKLYFEEEMRKRRFGTLGEFFMDIVSRCYEDGWYDKAIQAEKKRRKRSVKKAA